MRIPWGYGRAEKTVDEVERILSARYHPEYVRRLIAWLKAQEGRCGVGGHWRATGSQPDKFGFAPEGRSFHQDQRYADGIVGACAVDLVVRAEGRVHRAPYWSEVPRQGSTQARLWGLHCNVDGRVKEPWHIQPVEIDGWQSWVNAGRPAPRHGYSIPGGSSSTAPNPVPEGEWEEVAAIDAAMRVVPFAGTLKVGSKGKAVEAVQWRLSAARYRTTVDGDFGRRTEASVKSFQRANGLQIDGLVGKLTWAALGLKADTPAPTPEPEVPSDRSTVSYKTRPGDTWWGIAELAYGAGKYWSVVAEENGDRHNRIGPRGTIKIADAVTETVRLGDGWIAVAHRLGVHSWQELQRRNRHITTLHPGTVVFKGERS